MTLILFLIFLGLAVVYFWAAKLPDTWPSTRMQLLGAAWIILALAVLFGYVLFQETRGPSELEKYLPVYPRARMATWVPQIGRERYWIFESPDVLGSIAAFYEQVAAESGWRMGRREGAGSLYLKLEKAGLVVSVIVAREGNRSEISYQVTTKRDARREANRLSDASNATGRKRNG